MNVSTSPLVSMADSKSHTMPSPQLAKAANAFEANFLGELLKPMREDPLFGNGAGLGGDSLGSDGPNGGSMGTIGSLASEALAQAIVRQGGLGIAKMVLAQLAPVEQSAAQTATAIAGPKCGGCAAELTMTQVTASSIEAGSVAMLGEGNLSPAKVHPPAKNLTDKTARMGTAMDGQANPSSVEFVRPLDSQRQ
jgi:Rod binding domain-containing protein